MSSLSFFSISRLVERGLAGIEIEPPFAVADRAAGDGVGQHDGEQVQRGMGAHALEARLPIKLFLHSLAGRGERRAVLGNMHDGLAIRVVDRVDDLCAPTAREGENASVPGCPPPWG